MARRPLVMSPNYRAFVRGIRDLHRLAIDGRDESPESDAIRDAMDLPWMALSDAERKRAGELSEDLYSISDLKAEAPTEMNPQAQARLNDAIEARRRGDWDRALGLLRRWARHLPRASVSFYRGAIWLEAGDPESAVLFLEHASKLDRENGNYLGLYLDALKAVDPQGALSRAQEILEGADNIPPFAVATAAGIVLEAARPTLEADARRLLPVLERALARIEGGDESGLDHVSYAMTSGLLGVCHEFLGDYQVALDYLSRALLVDPNNDRLLIARGILLYGSSPRAITDFELAIRNNTPVIWPSHFMAHHFLLKGQFKDCQDVCDRASRIRAPETVKSEMAEWKAISQAELGFPTELVLAGFEEAIRLDPFNDRARHNQAIFLQSTRPYLPTLWEKRQSAEVRATGLAAWRDERAAA